MRQKAIKIIYILLVIVLVCSACADDSIHASADPGMLSSLRASYRGASLIALVTCTGVSKDKDGVQIASLEALEALAGTCPEAEFSCKSADFLPGASYLVYFSKDDAQDGLLVSNLIAYDPSSGTLTQGESTLRLFDLRADIESLQRVISAPAELLYYPTVKALTEASDAVFIGRIEQLPELTNTDFREASGTGVVEHSRPASVAGVRVFGSVKGELSYGERISFIYSPAFAGDILDSTTLKAFTCTEPDIPSLTQGAYYLFFLKEGPDPKQDYYFGVNPLQSHVALDGDTLILPARNEALASYASLPALINALRG